MFSKVGKQVNAANVIAVLALVFAMSGGAFALTGARGGSHATAQLAKKKAAKPKSSTGPRGPKGATGPAGPAGANGAAGAQGPAGPAGPAGNAGSNGTDGSSGAPGKSVLSGEGTPTAATGEEGDFYIQTTTDEIYGPKAKTGVNGGWKTGVPLKGEAGAKGVSGFTKELPKGETETGSWNAIGLTESEQLLALSFNIPLGADLAGSNVHFMGQGATPTEECPGSSSKPEAKEGNLCVYAEVFFEATFVGIFKSDAGPGESGAATAGALLDVAGASGTPRIAYGTWAVSAD
jgi:hypothetical protein